MTQELTPSEAVEVERFGIFDPERSVVESELFRLLASMAGEVD